MIYFIQADGLGSIKIGFTGADDAEVRLADLQVGCPTRLRLLGTIPGTLEDEKNLHRRFASARVTGEWFRPVPELLALLPCEPLKSCNGLTVSERSVSIRVLTVGRKQLSKALLGQLPESTCLDWDDLIPRIASTIRYPDEGPLLPRNWLSQLDPVASAVDLSSWVVGDVWGWVVGGRDAPFDDCRFFGPFRWVLFEHDGMLFRHKDSFDIANPWTQTLPQQAEGYLLRSLYPRRKQLPGWGDADQLFFGV